MILILTEDSLVIELFSPEDALLKVNLKIIEMFQAIYTRLFEAGIDRKVAKKLLDTEVMRHDAF